jgi:hypothetical protein
MMNQYLYPFLLTVYAVLAVSEAWSGNWPKALYWAGAVLLTCGVWWS